MKKSSLIITGIAALVLTIWALHSFRSNQAPIVTVGVETGRNLLIGINPHTDDFETLGSMKWVDLGPTADAANEDPFVRDRLIEISAKNNHPPALYLGALLLLAKENPAPALDQFNSVPINSIPPLYLYAPYRLQYVLRPGVPNAYREPLIRAVHTGALPPLIAARVRATEGEPREALEAYLRSDPAEWANYDAQIFKTLRTHAGLRGETGSMLLAALKAGRVPAGLRPSISALLTPSSETAPSDELRAKLDAFIRSSPEARKIVNESASRQLELRQSFLRHEYTTLVEKYNAAVATDLSDEAVLILALSTARIADKNGFERWSQELRRRYRNEELDKWLLSLKPAAP